MNMSAAIFLNTTHCHDLLVEPYNLMKKFPTIFKIENIVA